MKCGRGAGGFAASGTTRFPDVADTAYYLDAASWAADSGLMNGYSDGRSGVNDSITRQQVTAIFWRWAGSPETSAEDYAGEDAVSGYAKTAVDWARANGIVPSGRKPGSPPPRAPPGAKSPRFSTTTTIKAARP